jgi:hypothetical protein
MISSLKVLMAEGAFGGSRCCDDTIGNLFQTMEKVLTDLRQSLAHFDRPKKCGYINIGCNIFYYRKNIPVGKIIHNQKRNFSPRTKSTGASIYVSF